MYVVLYESELVTAAVSLCTQRELSGGSYRSGGSAGSRGTGRGGGGGGGKGGRNQAQGHSYLSGDTGIMILVEILSAPFFLM